MGTEKSSSETIDAYIAGFPDEVQARLQSLRRTIRETAPDAEESISYGIASFKLKGRPLIYFGAHQKHIGVYPAPRGVQEFCEELAAYEGGKGTLRLPFDEPLPLDLIRRIVGFRIKERTED